MRPGWRWCRGSAQYINIYYIINEGWFASVWSFCLMRARPVDVSEKA